MKARILVVDDNEQNRYLLEAMMKGGGFQPVPAANGVDALEKLRAEHFDLIITDILMPAMDGYQLCRECRSDPDLKDIPIVFYTATYTDDKDESLSLALGADTFVRKPLEPEKFISIITGLLRDGRDHGGDLAHGGSEADEQVLRLYNERLVEKLENKMVDLETSEKRFRDLWENVADLLFSLDADHRITDINHSKLMLGYDPAEVIGKPFTDFLSDASSEKADAFLRRTARKQDSSIDVSEITIVKKNGHVFDAELSMSTIYVDGRFVGTHGIARDITQRKKAERELKEQKKALQQKNAALKEVLAQIEADKLELQQQVTANVERVVLPVLQKLKSADAGLEKQYLSLLESGLHDLTSRFGARLADDTMTLTPRQMEICNMIKSGMTSKEIADLLHVSLRTVESHRNVIRKKLGIDNKAVNLATYLHSLE